MFIVVKFLLLLFIVFIAEYKALDVPLYNRRLKTMGYGFLRNGLWGFYFFKLHIVVTGAERLLPRNLGVTDCAEVLRRVLWLERSWSHGD